MSTAFDKMMRTRGDHRVFTEPFSIPWYKGPEQRSQRYAATEPAATFDGVLDEVLGAARRGPVFVKEMAYQLGPLLTADVLAEFTSTFIIRDPSWALPSLARIWPDFTDVEAGYAAQHRAWALAAESGQEPIVLDSDDLRREPAVLLTKWCEAVGIPWRPDALSWAPGLPVDWEPWAEWFAAAAASTGFEPPPEGDPPASGVELRRRIESCRVYYDELASRRLGA